MYSVVVNIFWVTVFLTFKTLNIKSALLEKPTLSAWENAEGA
jgi:hypothetical protein